ncbi:MAG: hypothetical protein IJ866_02695 [Alphaproteobacteria bacterium]|nr:hypothetical protein [Alphaproteobacteria bacterium]
MKTKTNILTVLIAAIMAVSAANADIASTTYVNGKITPVENKIDTHAANNDIHVTAEQKTAWSAKQDAITATNKLPAANVSGLANVATTGAYSDLTGTPTIAEDESNSAENRNNLVTVGVAYDIADIAAGIALQQQSSDFQQSADSYVATAGNYIEIGNKVASNLGKLDTAAKNAKDAADAAQGTANEAKSAAATNATAIATEKSAREAADTAINNKIGNVTDGKTVVEMINEAQSAATYDDTALAGRVKTIEDSAAYNSGITSALVTQINTNKTNIATNASDIDTLESGKQDKITDQNKLSAGLIATSATAQFVSDTEKSTWNAKQGAISDLATIRSNAAAGKGAADTIATYGDVVTHDASDFATSAQGGKADTALQASDITTGTSTMANGTISVKGEAVAVKGLGSAAYTASTAYATSAQGGKADTALQSVTANTDAGVVTNVAKNGTAITMTKAKVTESDLADAVVAKLGAGDSALQKADITTGTANGTIAVEGTDVSVKGLKSAAYTESSAYATAAQGGKADSALQKADITTGTSTMANGTISVKGEAVAVKGLGSAAYTASTAYATSAQGAKADSAIQSVTKSGTGNILSDISTTGGAVTVTVSGTAIPKPGTNCSDATNKCVLTYDNTGYTWEVIGR